MSDRDDTPPRDRDRDTPTSPHARPAHGPADVAGLDPEARLVRAETLLDVALDRIQQLDRRQGRQEATVVRIETRLGSVEGKIDHVLERISAVPTTARQAAVTTGVTGGIATLVVIVQQLLAALGHG